MGYFLTKIAAKAEKDERTLAGTGKGAAKGALGIAGLGAALGGGAYGASKGIQKLDARKGRRISKDYADALSETSKISGPQAGIRQREKGLELQKKFEELQAKNSKRTNWLLGKEEKLGRIAKKHGKWAVPALIGTGAIGGGLLLND